MLNRAAAGEDLAVRQLLLPHLARIARTIAVKYPGLKQCNTSVDDIIQETFVESYRRIQEYDPGKGALRTWLTTIADRRAMNAIRDAQRLKRGGGHQRVEQTGTDSSIQDLVEMLSAGGHTASRSAMRHEAEQAVHGVIAELPEDYRRAVELFMLEGKSMQETAAIMGRTQKAVQGLIDRAKIKMRTALGRLSQYE